MKKTFELILGIILALNFWFNGQNIIFWALALTNFTSFLLANSRAGLARLVLLTGGLVGLWQLLSTKPLTTWPVWLSLAFYLVVLGCNAWLTYHPIKKIL